MSRNAPFTASYEWKKIALRDFRFLSTLTSIYGEDAQVELYWDSAVEFNRIQADGVIAVRGTVNEQTVSVILNDFRVNGGSFGQKNMNRMNQFISAIDAHEGSLIFILNTLGARFTEGRSLFTEVFSMIPSLQRYRKNHLYVAATLGKCLGMGALFLGQAHYRIALGADSLINLTGPEVVSLFFGKESTDFRTFASATHQQKTNSLIHEILPDAESLYRRLRELVSFPAHTMDDAAENLLIPDEKNPKYLKSERVLVKILKEIGSHACEIFPQLSSVARTFLVRREGKTIGVIMNPPLHPNNLLTVRAVDRSQFAMDLFAALKIPVISVIDSPGGDPRASESDADAILKMVNLVHTMIEYPHGKMGIVSGRCFGGSCMFAFPKIFGSLRTVALEGAKIGIISESIVEKILESNPRMRQEWQENQKADLPDLSDMIAGEHLDAIVAIPELGQEISTFLRMIEAKESVALTTGGPTLSENLRNRVRKELSRRLPLAGLVLEPLKNRAGRKSPTAS